MLKFIVKYLPWSNHNLFGSRLDSLTISIRTFRNVLTFLVCKGLIHAYLVKKSTAHNEKPLYLEENNPISAKSADQILSLTLA